MSTLQRGEIPFPSHSENEQKHVLASHAACLKCLESMASGWRGVEDTCILLALHMGRVEED